MSELTSKANSLKGIRCSLPEVSEPKMSPQELVAFERDIATTFDDAKIRAPVHLYSNNEEKMVEVFKRISDKDWVLCTWRSHYQCLLKGVDPKLLKEEIMKGKSIALNFKEQKVLSSAIVTGVLPISVGLGKAIKMRGSDEKVFCFVGDMTSMTGSFLECFNYCKNHNLPVYWVIEDNNKSVCTDTRKTWNTDLLEMEKNSDEHIIYYYYSSMYPHAGAGKRVQF